MVGTMCQKLKDRGGVSVIDTCLFVIVESMCYPGHLVYLKLIYFGRISEITLTFGIWDNSYESRRFEFCKSLAMNFRVSQT